MPRIQPVSTIPLDDLVQTIIQDIQLHDTFRIAQFVFGDGAFATDLTEDQLGLFSHFGLRGIRSEFVNYATELKTKYEPFRPTETIDGFISFKVGPRGFYSELIPKLQDSRFYHEVIQKTNRSTSIWNLYGRIAPLHQFTNHLNYRLSGYDSSIANYSIKTTSDPTVLKSTYEGKRIHEGLIISDEIPFVKYPLFVVLENVRIAYEKLVNRDISNITAIN